MNFLWYQHKGLYDDINIDKKLSQFYYFFNNSDFADVYQPNDDTFLFLDIINVFVANNLYIFNNNCVSLEVGSGSGIISCTYLHYLKQNNININKHYCLDINPAAVALTEKLIKHYDLYNNVICIESDYFNNIDNNIKFDFIFFNPPYVTTDKEEYEEGLKKKNIYASWAGGDDGSEAIFKFIDSLNGRIKDSTNILLLLSMENKVNTIINKFKTLYDFKCTLLIKRIIINEYLGIFLFNK